MPLLLTLLLSSAFAEEMTVCTNTGHQTYRGWIHCTADVQVTEGTCNAYGEFTPIESPATTLYLYGWWDNPYCDIDANWNVSNNVCEAYGFPTSISNPCIDDCSELDAEAQQLSADMDQYTDELFSVLIEAVDYYCDDAYLDVLEGRYNQYNADIQQTLADLAVVDNELLTNTCEEDVTPVIDLIEAVLTNLDNDADYIFAGCESPPKSAPEEPDCVGFSDAYDTDFRSLQVTIYELNNVPCTDLFPPDGEEPSYDTSVLMTAYFAAKTALLTTIVDLEVQTPECGPPYRQEMKELIGLHVDRINECLMQ